MEELIEKGKLAKSASRVLGSLSASVKNNALLAIADALEKNSEFIKKFALVELVYYIAYIVFSLLNIYI